MLHAVPSPALNRASSILHRSRTVDAAAIQSHTPRLSVQTLRAAAAAGAAGAAAVGDSPPPRVHIGLADADVD
jgi:hypothetical protein